ncbi:hypothetical protein BSKO_03339 [Bryopsis sp. KO-2023]|nr:hypothetical protein BSKO_03339 [Bryopsis sp. KO-2023]
MRTSDCKISSCSVGSLHHRRVSSVRCERARGVDRSSCGRLWNRTKVSRHSCRALSDESAAASPPAQDVSTQDADARQELKWGTATVTENRGASADGTVRLLVLSVEDHVDYMDGRKLKRIQKAPRWIDSYKLPGQFVGVRFSPEDGNTVSPQRLLAVCCSPYEARRNSALLDASIIEILVERDGHPENEKLAGMAPGDTLQVSQVLGRGFASLFSSYVGLLSAMEDSRPLLMACVGTRGLAPLRAALNWAPVQAMAATQPITIIYVSDKQVSAACIQEWDVWRESGVSVIPVYVEQEDGKELQLGKEVLENVIFDRAGGLPGLVGGKVQDCAVLLAGLRGSTASDLAKRLRDEGVSRERLLFCEFF